MSEEVGLVLPPPRLGVERPPPSPSLLSLSPTGPSPHTLYTLSACGADGSDGEDGVHGQSGASVYMAAGTRGEDGTPGRDGTPGGNGKRVEVTVERLERGMTFCRGVRVHGTADGEALDHTYTLSGGESVVIDAPGGRGGAGGDGGRGGDGGSGSPGVDGMAGTPGLAGDRMGGHGAPGGNGTDGTDGGDGGDPGNAGNGQDGGDGGAVVVSVCPADSDLLGLIGVSVPGGKAGLGGHAAAGGRGGLGGCGGRGGEGGAPGVAYGYQIGDVSYPGVDGVRGTHGVPGRSGEPGKAGVDGVSGGDGRDGGAGSVTYQLTDSSGTVAETAPLPYLPVLTGVSLGDRVGHGLVEPGSEVTVRGVSVHNVGGLPTPLKNTEVVLSLERERDSGVGQQGEEKESVEEHRYPLDSLAAGDTTVLCKGSGDTVPDTEANEDGGKDTDTPTYSFSIAAALIPSLLPHLSLPAYQSDLPTMQCTHDTTDTTYIQGYTLRGAVEVLGREQWESELEWTLPTQWPIQMVSLTHTAVKVGTDTPFDVTVKVHNVSHETLVASEGLYMDIAVPAGVHLTEGCHGYESVGSQPGEDAQTSDFGTGDSGTDPESSVGTEASDTCADSPLCISHGYRIPIPDTAPGTTLSLTPLSLTVGGSIQPYTLVPIQARLYYRDRLIQVYTSQVTVAPLYEPHHPCLIVAGPLMTRSAYVSLTAALARLGQEADCFDTEVYKGGHQSLYTLMSGGSDSGLVGEREARSALRQLTTSYTEGLVVICADILGGDGERGGIDAVPPVTLTDPAYEDPHPQVLLVTSHHTDSDTGEDCDSAMGERETWRRILYRYTRVYNTDMSLLVSGGASLLETLLMCIPFHMAYTHVFNTLKAGKSDPDAPLEDMLGRIVLQACLDEVNDVLPPSKGEWKSWKVYREDRYVMVPRIGHSDGVPFVPISLLRAVCDLRIGPYPSLFLPLLGALRRVEALTTWEARLSLYNNSLADAINAVCGAYLVEPDLYVYRTREGGIANAGLLGIKQAADEYVLQMCDDGASYTGSAYIDTQPESQTEESGAEESGYLISGLSPLTSSATTLSTLTPTQIVEEERDVENDTSEGSAYRYVTVAHKLGGVAPFRRLQQRLFVLTPSGLSWYASLAAYTAGEAPLGSAALSEIGCPRVCHNPEAVALGGTSIGMGFDCSREVNPVRYYLCFENTSVRDQLLKAIVHCIEGDCTYLLEPREGETLEEDDTLNQECHSGEEPGEREHHVFVAQKLGGKGLFKRLQTRHYVIGPDRLWWYETEAKVSDPDATPAGTVRLEGLTFRACESVSVIKAGGTRHGLRFDYMKGEREKRYLLCFPSEEHRDAVMRELQQRSKAQSGG
ncbi:hypothetical protein KIPB_003333 [Kipferlia bialata]|uniref:PH domain-containing protein n=1 Tax=Kipferlia bialata TaxID=797122 RepID=A0A9K3CS27_9EUKA|nr:hypothetical protein KIPB_003333 [Kipferlia bialata]|eukprot:g3333.t1